MQIPERVDFNGIGRPFHFGFDDATHRLLVAGRAIGFGQLLD
jgi:hypothetical protein